MTRTRPSPTPRGAALRTSELALDAQVCSSTHEAAAMLLDRDGSRVRRTHEGHVEHGQRRGLPGVDAAIGAGTLPREAGTARPGPRLARVTPPPPSPHPPPSRTRSPPLHARRAREPHRFTDRLIAIPNPLQVPPDMSAPLPISVRLASDCALGSRGSTVTLSLTPTDVFTPGELSTFLAGYRRADDRADAVSPPVTVDQLEGKLRFRKRENAFQRVGVKGASGVSPIPRINVEYDLVDYACQWRYLADFVGDEVQQHSQHDLEFQALQRIGDALNLDRELDVWDLLGTSGNWASAQRLALGATQNWGSTAGADSDPIRDLDLARQASLMPVTDVWFNPRVAGAFLRHDKVRDMARFRLGDQALGAALTRIGNGESMDFELPGYPRFHVVSGRYLDDAAAYSYILGDVVVLTRSVPPSSSGTDISSCMTFRLRGPSNVGYEARAFRNEDVAPKGGIVVSASVADQIKMVAPDVGGIITGVWL